MENAVSETEPSTMFQRLRPTRRALLEAALLGGAASAAGGLLGSPRSGEAATPAPQDPTPPPYAPPPFELEELAIAQLRQGLDAGRYTARGLVAAYLGRIDALNHEGPKLHALIETNPQAVELAERCDAERRSGAPRGPLHGIPILLKDNIDTADRMTTTAGSLALEGSSAARDSTVAARLRAAGAILLGKANMSEWANFRSDNASSGWSSRGGQCRNPYALDRSPSGSSSGIGAGVAASLAAAGIGTETDGSIVSPASANSLVGIKPTLGLISRAGIIPISHSQDTAGPMARTVAEAALLLGVLAGPDERDRATAACRGKAQADYSRFLDPKGLKGARLGVARARYLGRSKKVDKLMEEAFAALKDAGAVLVDPADITTDGAWGPTEYEVLLCEFKSDLNAYLAKLGPQVPIHSLAEAIAFNNAHRERVMPYFGQELFEAAATKGPLSDPTYKRALAANRLLSRRQGIDATLARHRLDAILAPTAGPSWFIDLVNGDAGSGSSSGPAAVSGYASITVPAGYVSGLPIGLSFIGRAWSEPTLLKLAYAFETATRVRRPPRFLPTADLQPAA
jgi:amidase